jgi:hypothetical protein
MELAEIEKQASSFRYEEKGYLTKRFQSARETYKMKSFHLFSFSFFLILVSSFVNVTRMCLCISRKVVIQF